MRTYIPLFAALLFTTTAAHAGEAHMNPAMTHISEASSRRTGSDSRVIVSRARRVFRASWERFMKLIPVESAKDMPRAGAL